MRARLVLVAAALVVALATAGSAGAAVHWKTFRTPSKNIGCTYAPASAGFSALLRCDILSGLKPQPSRSCQLDWAGLMIHRRGHVRPVCAGDTGYPPKGRILHYGRHWKRHGIRCVSRRNGLHCRNRSGHGFALAREAWHRF